MRGGNKLKLKISIFVFVVIMAFLPYVTWQLENAKELKVAIVDKTVTDSSYAKHAGLTWILNYLKYEQESGKE